MDVVASWCFKPQPHRIIRFMDRTIGCDWAKVRPVVNVCYDIQQRSHTAIDIYARSRYHELLENIDGPSVVAINDRCTTIHDGWLPIVRSIDRCLLRPTIRAIVASCDRSYDNSWHPVTELTINRRTRRPMVRSIAGCNERSHDQS